MTLIEEAREVAAGLRATHTLQEGRLSGPCSLCAQHYPCLAREAAEVLDLLVEAVQSHG